MSALATGSLLLSGSNLYSFETENEIKNNSIDLSPLTFTDREMILKGNFIDAATLEPISSVIMKVKPLKNRLAYKQTIESKDGSYEIKTGFSIANKKVTERVAIEIIATGYKPLVSELYLSRFGCNVHCSIWKYNPNLKIDDSPKNYLKENHTLSIFDFHLVKA